MPNEATGQLTTIVHGKPRTAIQQPDRPFQRRARSRRSPTRSMCGDANGDDELHARSPALRRRHRRVRAFESPGAPRRCRSRRPRAPHTTPLNAGATAPTRSTSHAPKASSTSKGQDDAALGPCRRDPRGDPVRRTAGRRKARARSASQIGTATVHGGLGQLAVHVLRSGLHDRALQRSAVRPLDRRARGCRPVQPRHVI